MAERSTAAVDVAQQSGEPLPATADEATDDGAKAQERDAEAPTGVTGGQATEDTRSRDGESPEPPELHSGHKLARRYRLEECVTRLDGFSSWRAVDEKLRRAVGVHLLPAGHDRARSVLSAARSAALLGDPRFVQVLDAVEEGDLVYVVHEWLPDAVDLTAVLASGALPAHEAYQMVSQVSQGMASAHREGLAHLRLTPDAVLRSESGQFRIRGLAVDAALRGISADRPKRADTEAIGALLYAALTARWPYPEDEYGLTGLPKNLGLVPPDQVRAGVHRGLSELALRALANDGATPSRQEPPCTTPEELATAVGELPRIRPPEPETVSFAQHTAYRQPPARPVQHTVRRTAPAPQQPPPALPGRTGKALKWGVAALLIAALGLGSWQIAQTLIREQRNSQQPTTPTGNDHGGTTVHDKPLAISAASEFDPHAAATGTPQQVHNTIDGDPSTAWITKDYIGYANFGNLPDRRDGSGIVVDLGSVREVTGAQVTLYRPGMTVEVLAAAPAAQGPTGLSSFPQRLSPLRKADGTLSIGLNKPLRTRYVLVHVTSLPVDASGGYRGGISDIRILGAS